MSLYDAIDLRLSEHFQDLGARLHDHNLEGAREEWDTLTGLSLMHEAAPELQSYLTAV